MNKKSSKTLEKLEKFPVLNTAAKQIGPLPAKVIFTSYGQIKWTKGYLDLTLAGRDRFGRHG